MKAVAKSPLEVGHMSDPKNQPLFGVEQLDEGVRHSDLKFAERIARSRRSTRPNSE